MVAPINTFHNCLIGRLPLLARIF